MHKVARGRQIHKDVGLVMLVLEIGRLRKGTNQEVSLLDTVGSIRPGLDKFGRVQLN